MKAQIGSAAIPLTGSAAKKCCIGERWGMGRMRRSLVVIAFVVSCVFALGWPSPLAALVQLLGTTALIMGGTQHPLVDPTVRLPDVDGLSSYGLAESGLSGVDGQPAGYVEAALTKYIEPAGRADEPYNVVAVWTPEEFWPAFGSSTFDASVRTGLDNVDRCVHAEPCTAHVYPSEEPGPADGYAVFAYSQSARIASLEKARLIAEYRAGEDPSAQHAVFIMIGNPSRGNGGILQRLEGLHIPILDVTFDGASPTDSPVVDGDYLYPTVDIARQYDGWADFPVYALNLLADANAIAGIAYLHGDYFTGTAANPVAGQPYLYQGQVGDTNYYMLATKRLPILLPLAAIGVPDPILAVLDAPLRELIEQGYERDVPPGVPTRVKLVRLSNPVTDVVNLAVATATGLDDGLSLAAGDPSYRPFHTTPAKSTFGVGGPALPEATDPVAPEPPPVGTSALDKRLDTGVNIAASGVGHALGSSKGATVTEPDPPKTPPDVLKTPPDVLKTPPDVLKTPPDVLKTPPDVLKTPPDVPKAGAGEPNGPVTAPDTHTEAKPAGAPAAGAAADTPDTPNARDGQGDNSAPERAKRGHRLGNDRAAGTGGSAENRRFGRDSGTTAKPADRGAAARVTGPKHRAAGDGNSVGAHRHSVPSSSDGNGAGA
jgi:PE-PPE domain